MAIRLQPIDLLTEGWEKPTKEQDQIENGVLPVTDDLAVTLAALTTADLNGEGVFDLMMRSTKAFLKKEYDANRIIGKEYSAAYIQTLLSNMQNSMQFLLDQQQVQLLNSEIGLLRQQTVTELALTDDNIPQGLGFNFVPALRTAIPPQACWFSGGNAGPAGPAPGLPECAPGALTINNDPASGSYVFPVEGNVLVTRWNQDLFFYGTGELGDSFHLYSKGPDISYPLVKYTGGLFVPADMIILSMPGAQPDPGVQLYLTYTPGDTYIANSTGTCQLPAMAETTVGNQL